MDVFFELHTVDGEPIMIARAWVEFVTADPFLLKAYREGAGSILSLSGEHIVVRESYEHVMRYFFTQVRDDPN